MTHPVLGPCPIQCVEAVLQVEGLSAHGIFGSPDDVKLRSCATLFASIAPAGWVFERLPENYFDGQRDPRTLERLQTS